MRVAHRPGPRFAVPVVAMALVAVIGSPAAAGTSVPPEVQKGAIGHYQVVDGDTPGVTCVYGPGDVHKLKSFKVKAPSLWWPDTNSDVNTEHGRVGWQIIIEESAHPGEGPWTTAFKSTTLKATAYEDVPVLYDPAKRAPFSKRTVAWSKSGANSYRVVERLVWYLPSGKVRGTLKHWIAYYKLGGGAAGAPISVGSCPNKTSA